MQCLAEPPNLFVQNYANEVNEPYEGSAEEQYDGYNDSNSVFCNDALAKAVYSPNDVKYGNAEDELCNKGEIVEGFDQILHG